MDTPCTPPQSFLISASRSVVARVNKSERRTLYSYVRAVLAIMVCICLIPVSSGTSRLNFRTQLFRFIDAQKGMGVSVQGRYDQSAWVVGL